MFKTPIKVLNTKKLGEYKDEFAKMNNGGAFMYVSEDPFEQVNTPTIFETDESGHTTSLWSSGAHGGLIAVNDVQQLGNIGSGFKSKQISHSAVYTALQCVKDSTDGEYFAELFMEHLHKRLSRAKGTQTLTLTRKNIATGETVSAVFTKKENSISIKIGAKKAVVWTFGKGGAYEALNKVADELLNNNSSERFTYVSMLNKKNDFYTFADVLESAFKEGKKSQKFKNISKININLSISTENVRTQSV